ncbi:ubiquitin-associated domain-containing protein 1-like [Tubulanus polymorphus]|uniref:ubiquitin-associated domain-containing protein 1-like n=1 Tax=Tubulanus polymorphus TaxID=672921 RepID=UPI003DA1D4E6
MFVSENTTSIFMPRSMKVKVVNMEGMCLCIDVSSDCIVDKLKITALSHVPDPGGGQKASVYHRLLHVKTGRPLNDNQTLSDANVEENDELLLLRKRAPPMTGESSSKKVKEGPTSEAIKAATADLPPPKEIVNPAPDISSTSDISVFHVELRKILISLIEAAQKLQCLNPNAVAVFEKAEEVMKEQENPSVDERSLKQLTDMGFPAARAKKALLMNKMSTVDAMEWLLEHEGDSDIDEPYEAVTEESDESDQACGGATGGDPEEKSLSTVLKSFKAYKKRDFRANQRAMRNLIEMGFEEPDVRQALMATGNDEDAACEWLLSDKKATTSDPIGEGLDTDGPIYKAIMSNPTVQLGLNNPRSLLAFLSMLDNPALTTDWLNDPETGPMLIQISRIYHAEKNASLAESANSGTQSN